MFAEDLAPFFNTAEFATAVVFGGTTTVKAIFDNAYIEGGGFNVGGTRPLLTCRSADVAAVAVGTPVVVNAVSYTVAEIEPDGTGVSVLHLQRT